MSGTNEIRRRSQAVAAGEIPEGGLGKVVMDLAVEMAADLERSRINNEERRERIACLFGVAKRLQAIERTEGAA